MALEGWSEFFVAVAGASAALVGLIIVAMSVNIDTIVAYATLPSRAGATIAAMLLVVVVAVLGLIPGLPAVLAGWAVVVLALAALAFSLDSLVRMTRERPLAGIAKSSVIVIPTAIIGVGGALIAAGQPAGMYALAAGTILAFVGAVLNTWVLLVEVRR